MSNTLIITKVPYVKRILVTQLNNYLRNQIGTDELFGKNFKNIRVSEDHPFARLVASKLGIGDDSTSTTDLFPSLTVVVTENKYGQNQAQLHPSGQAEVGQAEIDHIIANRKTQYIISSKEVDRIQDGYNLLNPTGTTPENKLTFTGVEQIREASIAVEIWTANSEIKDRLFDLVIAFFTTFGRLSLREDYGIIVNNDSISGEQDGIYNFDFGYRLSGAMIRLDAEYYLRQFQGPDVQVLGRVVDVGPECY